MGRGAGGGGREGGCMFESVACSGGMYGEVISLGRLGRSSGISYYITVRQDLIPTLTLTPSPSLSEGSGGGVKRRRVDDGDSSTSGEELKIEIYYGRSLKAARNMVIGAKALGEYLDKLDTYRKIKLSDGLITRDRARRGNRDNQQVDEREARTIELIRKKDEGRAEGRVEGRAEGRAREIELMRERDQLRDSLNGR